MIKTLIHNVHALFVKDERETEKRIDELVKYTNKLFASLISQTSPEEYREEAKYVLENGMVNFPYKQTKVMEDFSSGIDKKNKLPFVLHKGKRLYFPQTYSLFCCECMYRSYISEECILGGGYREKTPHQYQTENFKVEEGDVLIDVGCAEALLSLDVIDKVSKVYLIEAEKEWIPALKATFKEYQDKVVIINKFVSDNNSESTITLENILKNENGKKIFVKMDIEGAEVSVLKESQVFLSKRDDIKLACCTYHREHDAEEILSIFESMGYHTEFSEGYMLFLYDEIKYPYFRHGILRAWK